MRTAKRIPLKVKFTVVGQNSTGTSFESEAETLVVSPIGGCFIFDQDVKEGDNLRLVASNGRAFTANVRWFKYDASCNLRYVGFRLLEPRTGWVIADGSQLRARASGS
ncbi:MAG TPA: hypothetical protein VMW38_27695 [Terriglobia bacterium]|nr:hypothetical protein [Terriglobia bacterium]